MEATAGPGGDGATIDTRRRAGHLPWWLGRPRRNRSDHVGL